MKIAILDNINEYIGLKICFPEADYYVCETPRDRTSSYQHYNFTPNFAIENITDKNYDILFVIMPLRHIINDEIAVRNINNNYHNKIKKIVDENDFKLTFWFDNEDYDVESSLYIPNKNNKTYFFKRNYNKNKKYFENVIPFPFIMFGPESLIEKMERQMVSKEKYLTKKDNNNVFFSGNLYYHQDNKHNVYVDRIGMYHKIQDTIFNPGPLDHSSFYNTLQNSKFSLDLLGAGNPNIRTFEILVSGSLMLQQKSDLVWPFLETFSEECIFEDENDYRMKLQKLISDEDLYKKCLENQYYIVNKYFNKEWIRFYIQKIIYKLI
jgi:spore maturation protein CgeB